MNLVLEHQGELMPELWLVGYGAWPVARRAMGLVEALRGRGVNLLVDVRLNPCGSDPVAGRPYGPKPWNLQEGHAGLVGLLGQASIGYEWLVELGNPQRRDPAMAVLRSHLADPSGGWPIHRGLDRLAALVEAPGAVVALLCACVDHKTCHRTMVGKALADRAGGGRLTLRDVRTGAVIADPPIIGP